MTRPLSSHEAAYLDSPANRCGYAVACSRSATGVQVQPQSDSVRIRSIIFTIRAGFSSTGPGPTLAMNPRKLCYLLTRCRRHL